MEERTVYICGLCGEDHWSEENAQGCEKECRDNRALVKKQAAAQAKKEAACGKHWWDYYMDYEWMERHCGSCGRIEKALTGVGYGDPEEHWWEYIKSYDHPLGDDA